MPDVCAVYELDLAKKTQIHFNWLQSDGCPHSNEFKKRHAGISWNLVASPSGYVIGRPDASQGAAENKT